MKKFEAEVAETETKSYIHTCFAKDEKEAREMFERGETAKGQFVKNHGVINREIVWGSFVRID